MKKTLIGLAVSTGFALASAPASAVVVAGIDFGVLGGLGLHLETMTLAEQFINPATTAPGTGAGSGYGVVSSVNGALNPTYCSPAPCTLYYIVNFSGGTFNGTGTEITFTGTDVTIYYSAAAPVNLLAQNSPTNLGIISGFTPYATFDGHGNLGGGQPAGVVSVANGSLSGSTLNLTGSGLLDVDLADGIGNAAFEAFINGSAIPDAAGGFADIVYTESANNTVLNPADFLAGLTVGCGTGTAATGQWCWQGTLNTRGTTVPVPEPGSLALLSLGLLGAGFVARRKRAK